MVLMLTGVADVVDAVVEEEVETRVDNEPAFDPCCCTSFVADDNGSVP